WRKRRCNRGSTAGVKNPSQHLTTMASCVDTYGLLTVPRFRPQVSCFRECRETFGRRRWHGQETVPQPRGYIGGPQVRAPAASSRISAEQSAYGVRSGGPWACRRVERDKGCRSATRVLETVPFL